MLAANPSQATGTDPADAFAIVVLFTATFVAVGLYVLFQLTNALSRCFINRTRRRVHAAKRFLAIPRFGRCLWLIDILVVVGSRSCVAIYGSFVLLFLVPLFLTVGSLEFAASLIRF